jgi:hypothetical protein
MSLQPPQSRAAARPARASEPAAVNPDRYWTCPTPEFPEEPLVDEVEGAVEVEDSLCPETVSFAQVTLEGVVKLLERVKSAH